MANCKRILFGHVEKMNIKSHFELDRGEFYVLDSELIDFLAEIYREARYLKGVDDLVLEKRLIGLGVHLVNFDLHGRPMLVISSGKIDSAFLDVLEESRLRNKKTDQIIGEFLKRFVELDYIKNYERINRMLAKFEGKKCLFKFTNSQHVSDILGGKVRFKTASSYKRDGYNIAIEDDEININHTIHGIHFETADGLRIPVRDNKITVSAAGEYYISCFSALFDMKLYTMFINDSCVVISNADKFVELVLSEFESTYPDYYSSFGCVGYIDPYRQLSSKFAIEFRKSINYEYQKEYRFVSFAESLKHNLGEILKICIDSNQVDYHVINMRE